MTNAQPQTALLHLTQPDALGVLPPERAQFLLLDVAAGDRVGVHRLQVRIGDDAFSPATELLQRQWFVGGDTADRYGADHVGWVAFDLPPVADTDISLAVEGTDASTPLADAVGKRLADPPDFTVESVVREGTAVRVRVRNGGGDGVFRAALNLSGTVYTTQPVSFQVEGDRTHERTVEVGYGEDATYTLLWPGGERTV